MNKILITGSSGYIGQHLCSYLSKLGYHVVGLDYRDIGGSGCSEFIYQNILDGKEIRGEFLSVVHLAALVQVGVGQKAFMDYHRTNVVGTMNMLERIQYENFIFASTCQAENSTNVYGQTKNIAEMVARQYLDLYNKPYTIFRFGNVVGSSGYKPTNLDGLMHNLIKAKETGKFYLYGSDYETKDGTANRDYIHVMEICHAIQKAIEIPSCEKYEYLGHGRHYTVMECIKAFKSINNCDFEVIVKDRRFGDVAETGLYNVSTYMQENKYSIEQMMEI